MPNIDTTCPWPSARNDFSPQCALIPTQLCAHPEQVAVTRFMMARSARRFIQLILRCVRSRYDEAMRGELSHTRDGPKELLGRVSPDAHQ